VRVTLQKENIAPPVLLLTTATDSSVNQTPVLLNLTANVALVNFGIENVSLVNSVVSAIKKENDLLYALTIVPIQQGDFSIEIPENAVLNADSEGNSASNKLTFTYDVIKPYVLAIKRRNLAEEITQNDTLEFTVTFSEAVENVFSTDFVSVAGATFTLVKENDASYVITVGTIADYFGAVSLNVKSGTSIQDKAGNLLLNALINVHQN
jgi:hypothetical protein